MKGGDGNWESPEVEAEKSPETLRDRSFKMEAGFRSALPWGNWRERGSRAIARLS